MARESTGKVIHWEKHLSASMIFAPVRFCTSSRTATFFLSRARSVTKQGEGHASGRSSARYSFMALGRLMVNCGKGGPMSPRKMISFRAPGGGGVAEKARARRCAEKNTDMPSRAGRTFQGGCGRAAKRPLFCREGGRLRAFRAGCFSAAASSVPACSAEAGC